MVRKRTIKTRICGICGIVESVRSDNLAVNCSRCSRRVNGAISLEKIKRRGNVELTCSCCEQRFFRIKSKVAKRESKEVYCSVQCRNKHKSIERSCYECDAKFRVAVSTARQGAARFCSRNCYEKFLCRTDHTPYRGSVWKRIRGEIIRFSGFCAICGTRKNLQVHHITPFRLNADNSFKNLIPLCVRHHKHVEMVTVECEAQGVSTKDILGIIGPMLRRRQARTLKYMKGIWDGR